MSKISILKVENPSCLWGRVVQSLSGTTDKTQQHNRMLAEINLFYHDVNLDLHVLKPTVIEEGKVYVVLWAMINSWCRAVVESLITDSVSARARCLLVDYGERLIVDQDHVRVAVKKFLQLPFWVRRFQLARIKPTTLCVSVCEEKAELKPSSQWDSSATLYLHNLLQASTLTEAVLFETESDSTSIELYLTVGEVKICVNDDLVAKKFAYYSNGSPECSRLEELDLIPVMLPPRIFTQAVSPTSDKLTTEAQLCGHGEAGGCITESSSPQSQHDLTTSKEDHSRQWRNSSHLAAAESDSSDSSLAAALTRNISLFKFKKFLNPGSGYEQATKSVSQHEEINDHEAATAASCASAGQDEVTSVHNNEPVTPNEEVFHMSEQSEAASLDLSHVVNQTDDDTSSSRSVESGPTKPTKMKTEVDWTCSRLLEWLNPEPLNSASDSGDDAVIPIDPMSSGVLVHSAFPVEPCTSLDDAPITDALRSVLRRKQYYTLSPADRYSWPAVSRGRNTIIISHNVDQPLSYLAPLLNHILLNSIYCSFTSSTGPIVVLLCPNWERVQTVYDLLDSTRVAKTLHPFILVLGVGKDEAKTVSVPKNCLLLVTTPFSLVRLLSAHCFMFLRLCHLVLDEADHLFMHAPDQMATILQHFQKVISGKQNTSRPQQLVAVAKQWSIYMEDLLTNYMAHPCIVITIPEEAALYGNVQQLILMTPESSKILELLGMLDSNPDVGQKTLIITNSAQEVENVFMATKNNSLFCLKAHEGLTHQFDVVIKEWKKIIGHGTHVILVTTNECLKCFGIRDATCVIHYSFPTSPKLFGNRLFCMSDNFRNLSELVISPDQTELCPQVPKSLLLISERNAPHVVGVLRYLRRTKALLSPELLSFAEGVVVSREDLKTNKPLCSYLKSFGVCRDSSTCPDRHRFILQLDQSELPASGVIEIVPVHIKSASVLYGRIITKENCGFDSLASEMASYYADKKPGALEILDGALYAVEEDNIFHRVKVLSVPERGDCLFFRIFVRFIDAGKEQEVKSYQVLELPEQFHLLPAQAVEIIVCSVKPVDAEINWHPKVTRAISQKVKGLLHRARAVLSLGNTVFVDSMVRMTQVPGMKTFINEYAVQAEILKTGMGIHNPEHLDLLRELCQRRDTTSSKEADHVNRLKDGPVSLEIKMKAEKYHENWSLSDIPQLEPLSTVSSINQSVDPESTAPQIHPLSQCHQKALSDIQAANTLGNIHAVKLDSDEHLRTRNGGKPCLTNGLDACFNPCENGLPADDYNSGEQVTINTSETDSDDSEKRFHPQVCWYQTADSVFATVKLLNPKSQHCDFYPDVVTYSGTENGRTYKAILELHGNINADLCRWEMKSNEPLLILIKQQRGYWDKFLRNKNVFVSYDMNHVEEHEDKATNDGKGLSFFENTGEDDWFVSSESDSD